MNLNDARMTLRERFPCPTCNGGDPGCSCGACGIAEGYGYSWCTNNTGCPDCVAGVRLPEELVERAAMAQHQHWMRNQRETEPTWEQLSGSDQRYLVESTEAAMAEVVRYLIEEETK